MILNNFIQSLKCLFMVYLLYSIFNHFLIYSSIPCWCWLLKTVIPSKWDYYSYYFLPSSLYYSKNNVRYISWTCCYYFYFARFNSWDLILLILLSTFSLGLLLSTKIMKLKPIPLYLQTNVSLTGSSGHGQKRELYATRNKYLKTAYR